jgi:two-component system, NtrC family, sensor kinase
MLGQKPVRLVGWNLGLRLYLLLVAIFFPTFMSYYVYTIRSIEALHETEVDTVIRMTSIRIEHLAATFGALDAPGGRELGTLTDELKRIAGEGEQQEALARELRRIAAERQHETLAQELAGIVTEPNGIEGVSLFVGSADDRLSTVASAGPLATGKPVLSDSEALSSGKQQKSDVLRGDRQFQSVSVPMRVNGDIRGVLHLEVVPKDIGLGRRIREVKANLLLGATGLVLAVGLVLAIFFHYSVRGPIRQLSDTMEDAAEGNLSALVDIRTGEFGWLAATYNRMMRRLKQSVDENRDLLEQIKTFNVELRGKVEAATAELAAKNTQLEGANERLLTQQKRLTSLEKLATLGEIATIIAHELGTPLNAISGHLQLLLADNVSDPNVVSRLRVIDGQVDRLTGIVRGVLKAMRVPPPRYSPIDVRRVIRDVVDLFSPTADKRKISVHLRLEESLPNLQADPDQLQQVFMNLFSNAIDAMKGGGVLSISARFVPVSEAGDLGEGGGVVRVAVSDTGEGMDEETARHAFEPFYTTRNVETDVGASIGMGLGLSICRQIIKNHYGEIAVRSEQGRGTEFTLLIPINPPALRASAPTN